MDAEGQGPSSREPPGAIAVFSRGILRIPGLEALLGAPVVRGGAWLDAARVDAVAGWGRRRTSVPARRWAERHGKPYLALEDGFLRSLGSGAQCPPLSLVVDDLGVYYDASMPSRLDRLCEMPLEPEQRQRAFHFMAAWREGKVSKYNSLRDINKLKHEDCVLVVDQTFGDASIRWGNCDDGTFGRMVEAALAEHPDSRVLVKTHPDVRAGKARGCIDPRVLAAHPRVEVLADNVHPADLLAHARAVYVATSQMGFEALIHGRPVRCFGMPFYAGRGLTVDDLPAPSWRSPCDLLSLVHAALIAYPRYLDPATGERCEPERVLAHLALQRRLRGEFPPVVDAVGFSVWKRPLVKDFLAGSEVVFRRRIGDARPDRPVVVWGAMPVGSHPGPVLRMEDGFLRSVGLGAALARPLSWVVDDAGIHYDAARPSRLEQILAEHPFDQALLARARRLRERIVDAGIAKYNLGGEAWSRPPDKPHVVLVVGQVETDAAVALGATTVRTNAALVAAARARCPGAHLLYKPHPDVVSGLRKEGPLECLASAHADEVVADVPIQSLLACVDEVHVITSLAGFEALLRGKLVVCHGRPFYAGWGLTQDLDPPERRNRALELDQLVAAVLILYPRYVHPRFGYFASPEEVIDELVALRGKRGVPLWRRLLLPFLRYGAR